MFYRRGCLGTPSPCWKLARFSAEGAQAQAEWIATRAERKEAKARRRRESDERRAARERHAIRVNQRHEVLMAYREKWKQSDRPWKEWARFKKALKQEWRDEEALELGRDALRLAGKPLDAPGADAEAYRLGLEILLDRMGNRLLRSGG